MNRSGGTSPRAGRRQLAALWALALGRFRDYLHWATGAPMSEAAGDHQAGETARDPCQDQGETHDPDR